MEQASKGHELAFYDSINFDQINVTEWFNCNMTRTTYDTTNIQRFANTHVTNTTNPYKSQAHLPHEFTIFNCIFSQQASLTEIIHREFF